MKGSQKVIEKLNELLTAELSSIDSYFVHSRIVDDLGYSQLANHLKHEMEDEQAHAGAIIERIIFLEGTPDLGSRLPFKVDRNVKSMLEVDLKFEFDVRKLLLEGISLCMRENDHVTRKMLEKLLFDTEDDHIDWLETQINLINTLGEKAYLAEKM